MNKRFSTAEIPTRFLKATFHVGHIPLRTLASEPRVLYTLYIPPEPYCAYSDQAQDGKESSTPSKLPLLVHVHGTTRNFSAFYDSIKKFADTTPCAVLTPIFPAGLEGPNDLHSYKHIRSTEFRFDLIMLSMLDEVAQVWPGIDTAKIWLQGFSGGAQFAHRFFYLHPERLAAISIGAPGSVTLLDDNQAWPQGTKDVQSLFGESIDKGLLRKVAIQLVIGGNDNTMHGGPGFSEWVQKVLGESKPKPIHRADDEDRQASASPIAIAQNRIASMQELREGWMANGIESQLDVVDGVSHNFEGVVEHVLKFMRPLMQSK